MSFINKIIGPDEKLIGRASAHWIYGVKGLSWLVMMAAFGVFLQAYGAGFFNYVFRNSGADAIAAISRTLFWLPTSLGAVMFFLYFLQMISLEVALTTKRVIDKKGLIFIDIKEVDIEEIKEVNVDNGILGRFLNYGYIKLDARFVSNIYLPA